MRVNSTRISLGYLLPLLSLALWVVLIATPATIAYMHLQHWAHGAPAVQLHRGLFQATVRRENFVQWSLRMATVRKDHLLMALNLPAASVEALVSRLASAWPSTWYPAAFTSNAWAAITWPFYCLPFWALAGTGIDALLGRRSTRIGWLILGAVLCLLCAFLGTGLTATSTADDRAKVSFALWGFALWTLLYAPAVLTIARKLWRRRKASHRPV